MAVYTNTVLNNITIDQKWDMDVMEYRYAEGVIFPKVLNKSQLVKESGLQVSIDVEPQITAATVGSEGAFTPSAAASCRASRATAK